ncbi:MAG: glycosyltransferase family 9 protein [Bacteroidetes bacterium]|nr:glycosyltransferase family 9 protein [Bacteroidota bacterium]
MKYENIQFNCRYFRGDVPCIPNKERNKICDTCDEFSPVSKRILIIKLGAVGDVIRSTPLAVRYRKEFPGCHITWFTHTPGVLPKEGIDSIRTFDFRNVYDISHRHFDIAVNLDKEPEACALLSDLSAGKKYGFTWDKTHIDVANPDAQHKLLTGLFDNLSMQNRKSYQEEIFELCGYKFNKEPYLININTDFVKKWSILRNKAHGNKVIGLNTGCGRRWTTRLWPEKYWIQLVKKLQKKNYFPVLLGGPEEEHRNKILSQKANAFYPGTFSLEEFIGLAANCDTIVTGVTMMLHIAVALKKPVILFNNIFNKYEFDLYGNGIILEPSSGCDCFYGQTCKRDRHCMFDIGVENVLNAVKTL